MTNVEAFWKGAQNSIKRASKKSTPFRSFTLNDITIRVDNRRMMMKTAMVYLRKRKRLRILINL